MYNMVLVNGLELNVCIYFNLNSTAIFFSQRLPGFSVSWQAQSNQEIGCLHWLDKGELRLVKAHLQSVCVQIEKESLTEDN